MSCFQWRLHTSLILASSLCLTSITGAVAEPFRDCPECPEMVTVPAGRALLGSSPWSRHHDADEGPRYMVNISHPFAVGRFEVTFSEWDACVQATVCRPLPEGHDWGRGQRPVMYVSWYDAQAYVQWLKLRTGQPYRLLSEAEWEYAARAGRSTTYVTGECISTQQANFNGQAAHQEPCEATAGVAHKGTIPVGQFAPNGFGLYDMAGNLSEWVQDCWHADHRWASTAGLPRESGDCRYRVTRGGSWADDATELRTARRSHHAAEDWNPVVGFRVAKDLSSPSGMGPAASSPR